MHLDYIIKYNLFRRIQSQVIKQMQVTELELLQLFQYAMMYFESVDYPIIQEVRDCCSIDEKASLFMDCITNNPFILVELKYDKKNQNTGEI